MTDDNDDWGDVFVSISAKEVLASQEKDREVIRLAVEEVLLPSLQGKALHLGRAIVDRCGAYNLYIATEAVSSLLNRYLIENPTRQIIMDNLGDIRTIGSFDLVFTFGHLAIEVDRFIDRSTSGAFVMVHWVTTALKYQPRLLRDFIATAPEKVPYVFLLTKVDSKERIDDPAQRWRRSPSKQS